MDCLLGHDLDYLRHYKVSVVVEHQVENVKVDPVEHLHSLRMLEHIERALHNAAAILVVAELLNLHQDQLEKLLSLLERAVLNHLLDHVVPKWIVH